MTRSVAQTFVILVLVLLVLLLGVPLAMPMGASACPECRGSGAMSPLAGVCVAILGGLLLLAWAAATTTLAGRSVRPTRIAARSLERPPRSA